MSKPWANAYFLPKGKKMFIKTYFLKIIKIIFKELFYYLEETFRNTKLENFVKFLTSFEINGNFVS
jgi:hypothetical protein